MNEDKRTFQFSFELDRERSLALAQFLKRVTWTEMRGCAVDEVETYLIRDALGTVREAVNEGGFNPR